MEITLPFILHPWWLFISGKVNLGTNVKNMLTSTAGNSFSNTKLSCLIFILNAWVQGGRTTQV